MAEGGTQSGIGGASGGPFVPVTPDDPLAPLLLATAEGDRVAFEELYRLTAAKLFGLCLRILPRRAEAEDALQECYIAIWRKAAMFDPARGGALGWLVALARNRAIDRLRAGGSPADHQQEAEDFASARAEHDARGLQRELADCLGLLEPRDARFVTTAFFRGDTYAELADAAGLPLGTVKTRIRRALLKLRECLA